jgi:O-antigen/teichoic acid export membrane protein
MDLTKRPIGLGNTVVALKRQLASSKSGSLVRHGTSMVLWRIVALAIGAGGSIWVTRCMGPVNLGISAIVVAACTQIGLFIKLNQEAHYIRLYKVLDDPAKKRQLLAGAFTLRLVIAAAATAIGLVILGIHGLPRIWWLPVFAGIPLLFFDQNSPNWILQAQENQPAQYRAIALKCVIVTAFAVVFFRPGMRAGSDLLLTAMGAAFAWFAAWYWALENKADAFAALFSWTGMKSVGGEIPKSIWLVITGFVTYGYTQFQLPLLAYLRPVAEVGMFRSASSLTEMANSFLMMIPALLYPRYVVWNRRGSAYLWQRQMTLLRWLLCATILVSIVVAIADPVVYPLVFGKPFAPAANCFTVLLIAKLVAVLNGIFAWGLLSQGADRTNLFIMSGTAVVSITLNLLLIPHFGIMGAAVVNLISEGLILAGCLLASKRLARNSTLTDRLIGIEAAAS